jgi:hypothetical protein
VLGEETILQRVAGELFLALRARLRYLPRLARATYSWNIAFPRCESFHGIRAIQLSLCYVVLSHREKRADNLNAAKPHSEFRVLSNQRS